MTRDLAVILILRTDDPRFGIVPPQRGPQEWSDMRQAVVDNLSNIARVVAVMPEAEARLIIGAHISSMDDPDRAAAFYQAAAAIAQQEAADAAAVTRPRINAERARRGERIH